MLRNHVVKSHHSRDLGKSGVGKIKRVMDQVIIREFGGSDPGR